MLITTAVFQRLAVKRLVDIGVGVLTPLSEQLAKPFPNALVLLTLDEAAKSLHKVPAGMSLTIEVYRVVLSMVVFPQLLEVTTSNTLLIVDRGRTSQSNQSLFS